MDNKLKIFCSYAPADKSLMENFRAHLRILELGSVEICYTHDILPGKEWREERDRLLQAARLILLLISADFVNSPENYKQEAQLAMTRHNAGQAHVIPIILRPVHWQETVFGKLPPLPGNGKAVTDGWPSQDHAFFSIISGLKQAISGLQPNLILAPTPGRENAAEQLTQILQAFKQLRGEIARSVTPSRPGNFSLADTEVRYNQLYGDALVFLATYLPEMVADTPNNFAETVYRKTRELLRKKSPFDIATVFVARTLIPYLAQIEKLGMQIDACTATLEGYQ
jgi:hypothetical protein